MHDSDSRRAVQFGKQRHITKASATLYIVHADIRFVLHGYVGKPRFVLFGIVFPIHDLKFQRINKDLSQYDR